MTGRRKGTPCACEMDPCSCGSSKGKCVRAVNNVSPDPNGDLVIRGGAGIEVIQSGDDLVINTVNPKPFVAGDNIEINPSGDDLEIRVTDDISVQDIDASGDVNIGGTLNVAGDIIQQGSSYETHAEKVYTTNDYIYMRDGAVGGLAIGAFSGFQVEKYDGTNDGRLVVDKDGIARVGDIGDEQPLMTRDEIIPNGALLKWDSTDLKAVPVSNSDGIARAFTGTVSFTASAWASDVTAPPDFPYSHEIQVSTEIEGDNTEYPVVSLSPYNTENALLAPFCDTYPAQGATPGGVKVYASAVPTTQIALDYMIIKKVTV